MANSEQEIDREGRGAGPDNPNAIVNAGALYALLEHQVFPYINQAAQEAVDKALAGYTGRLEEGGDVYKKLLVAATKAAQEAAGKAIDKIGGKVGIGKGETGKRGGKEAESADVDYSDEIEKLRKELEEDGSIYTALLDAVGTKYGEDIRSAVQDGLKKGGYIREAIADVIEEAVDRKLKDYGLGEGSGKNRGRGQATEPARVSTDASIPTKGSTAYRNFMEDVREAGREGAEEAFADLLSQGSLGDGRVEIKAEDGGNKRLRLGTVLNDLVERAAGTSKTVSNVLAFLGYTKGNRKGLEPKGVLNGFNNVVEMTEELRKLRKDLEEKLSSRSGDSAAMEKLEQIEARVEEFEKGLAAETEERKKSLGDLKENLDFLTEEFEKIGEEGQVFEERDK